MTQVHTVHVHVRTLCIATTELWHLPYMYMYICSLYKLIFLLKSRLYAAIGLPLTVTYMYHENVNNKHKCLINPLMYSAFAIELSDLSKPFKFARLKGFERLENCLTKGTFER